MEIGSVGLLLFAVFAASISTAVSAHHSPAVFDMSRQVTVRGVVNRVEWVNPHVYVYVDVASEAGAGPTVSWEIEGFPPAGMRRMGWSPDTLIAGTSIQVTGHPARKPEARSIFPLTIQQGDNTLFDTQAALRLATQASPPATGAAGLDGVWETQVRLRLFPHFFTGRARRNLTESAAAAAAQYDHTTMNPAIQCTLNPPPFSMMISDLKRITTDGNVVRITSDLDGGERVIHMNVDSHQGATDSILGHSIGRWEGETLVVHSTHFSPHLMGNGAGVQSGSGKELVERLTLNENKTILTYQFELSDPEFLTAPLADDVLLYFRPGAAFATEPCDPKNARRYLEY